MTGSRNSWLISRPDVHLGQVVKRYQGKRVVDTTRRMTLCCLGIAQLLLVKSHGGTKLNTAFIERLNATFRSRLAILVRRSRALIRNPETLEPMMCLMGSVYNSCTEPAEVSVPNTRACVYLASSAVTSGLPAPLPSPPVLPIIFGLLGAIVVSSATARLAAA